MEREEPTHLALKEGPDACVALSHKCAGVQQPGCLCEWLKADLDQLAPNACILSQASMNRRSDSAQHRADGLQLLHHNQSAALVSPLKLT